MNYKNLLRQIYILIANPAEAWKQIEQDKSLNVMYSNFLYPMVALTACATFLGVIMHSSGNMAYPIFQQALTKSCAVAVALLGGFYLTTYLLDLLFTKYIEGLTYTKDNLTKLVGYSFVVIFLSIVLSSFFPRLNLILIMAQIYIIYIVWQAMGVMITPNEDKKMKLTWIIGVGIVCVPFIIQSIFMFLVKFLN
mgnify:FL=1